DLSATAEIVTDTRTDALSVPIIALTVRPPPTAEADGDDADATAPDSATEASAPSEGDAEADVEGVFVVRDGKATFVPVGLGITGQEHFEIVSGVDVGDTVVSGPYQAIRQLQNGDPVREMEGSGGEAGGALGSEG
ncbi:MAG: hypothetical protein PVI57_18560, partial [Gemmatimonadota bacterium]